MHFIIFKVFAYLYYIVPWVCYSKPGCTGDIIEAPGPTVKDCCVGTNDGQSYEDRSGACVEDQCIGKSVWFPYYTYFVFYIFY